MTAEAIVDAAAWRDIKVIRIANIEWVVDLSDAKETLGVRLKPAQISEAIPRSDEIAAFGRSLKTAKGQEPRVRFHSEV